MKKFSKIPSIPYPSFSRMLRKKVGAPPGTIIHTGEKIVESTTLKATDYSKTHIEEFEVESPELITDYLRRESTTWLRMNGLHDVAKIQQLGKQLDIHQLLLEDIANTEQRPKKEEYARHLFIITRLMYYDRSSDSIKSEQISLLLGDNYLVTIQESNGSYFDVIRERLDVAQSRLRNEGSSYLAYAIIDVVVDYYHQVMALLSDNIEQLEDDMLKTTNPKVNDKIHALRRDLISLRRAVWPMRDVVQALLKEDSKYFDAQTRIYLRDVYDHLAQICDHIDSSRDMVMSLQDNYMNAVSHKLNEVMRILTIIATIFIPLTFIAGIYGMNFDAESSPYNMPELHMYYGYPLIMGIMALIAIVMVIYFKRKNWF